MPCDCRLGEKVILAEGGPSSVIVVFCDKLGGGSVGVELFKKRYSIFGGPLKVRSLRSPASSTSDSIASRLSSRSSSSAHWSEFEGFR